LHHCKPDVLSQRIGAVNTIDRAGAGYNTDGVGAVRALEEAGVTVKDASILLLGAGALQRRSRHNCCSTEHAYSLPIGR